MNRRPSFMPTPPLTADMKDSRPTVLLIAGPTASGKSALAAAVAAAWEGTVINADSMQVYRDLELLTARPRGADLKTAPHRLYGVPAAADACPGGRWCALARARGERGATAARRRSRGGAGGSLPG